MSGHAVRLAAHLSPGDVVRLDEDVWNVVTTDHGEDQIERQRGRVILFLRREDDDRFRRLEMDGRASLELVASASLTHARTPDVGDYVLVRQYPEPEWSGTVSARWIAQVDGRLRLKVVRSWKKDEQGNPYGCNFAGEETVEPHYVSILSSPGS